MCTELSYFLLKKLFFLYTCAFVFNSFVWLLYPCMYRYMAANQKCKDADGTIKIESKNVEHLTKVVEENFNEVCYSSRFLHTI